MGWRQSLWTNTVAPACMLAFYFGQPKTTNTETRNGLVAVLRFLVLGETNKVNVFLYLPFVAISAFSLYRLSMMK